MDYNFDDQLKKGQQIERLFADYFTRKGKKVRPSDDQQKGDLIIGDEYVEIKTDFYNNDRYLFELLHLQENKILRPGWLMMPHYDHLFYYKESKPGQYLYFSKDMLHKLYQDYYLNVLPGRMLKCNNPTFKTLNFCYAEPELVSKQLTKIYKIQ